MSNKELTKEVVISPEVVKVEPVVEVVGKYYEVSRSKFGGSDSSPTKRRN